MKMTTRIKNFIKAPASFSCRKIANLCKDEDLDKEFMFKYKEYLNWKILLVRYAHKFTFEELDLLLPIIRNRKLHWEFITTQTFNEKQLDYFLKEHIYNSHWIFRWQKVSEKFIDDHFSKGDMSDICEFQALSEEWLRKHIEDINTSIYGGKICWDKISQYQVLSEKFMKDFNHKLDWRALPKYQNMSNKFIKEYADKFWWGDFPYDKLSEEFIEEMADRIYWPELCKRKKLSNQFIEKWAYKIDWFKLCYFNKVDSSILSKYADKLDFDWSVLTDRQDLSEEFLREFANKIEWTRIIRSRKLNENFIREMYNVLGDNVVWVFKTHFSNGDNYSDQFKKEIKDRYYNE